MDAVASAALCGEKHPPPSAFQLFYRSHRSIVILPGHGRRVADMGSLLWYSLPPPGWSQGVDRVSWPIGRDRHAAAGLSENCSEFVPAVSGLTCPA